MPSLEQVLATVQAIYDAALDEAAWPGALERLADLLGGSGGGVIFPDGPRDAPPGHLVRLAPETWAAYTQHYRLIDPVSSFVQSAAPGVYTDRMAVPRAELLRSAIHNEFCLPNDTSSLMMASSREPGASALLVMGRPARVEEFGEEERALLALLLPHVANAARLRMHLLAANARADFATEALDRMAQAVVLVGAGSEVIHANSAAQRMFREADGLGANSRGLCAARQADTAALRRLIAGVAGGAPLSMPAGTLQLERPSGRRSLSVTIAPLGRRDEVAWLAGPAAVVLVLITDPERDPRPRLLHVRAAFDLTGAEAVVAGLIARGRGVKHAASVLRVAPSTVRTHLHRVFAKTGTQRQAELAALWEQFARLDLNDEMAR